MPRAIAEIKAILAEHRNAALHRQEPHDGYGRNGFDPNQPRVPAGNPDGGEWTNNGTSNAVRLAASGKPPHLPRGKLQLLLELGLLAIEVYRNLPWDLFGGLKGGTVAWTVVDGREFYGANSGSSAYTPDDDAAARRMRSRMLTNYPDVMSSANIGEMPNNVLFHAEATVLLRAANKNGGTLAGKTVEVIVDREMCNNCQLSKVLPKLGLELGNPTVTFVDKVGTVKTMRNGNWDQER